MTSNRLHLLASVSALAVPLALVPALRAAAQQTVVSAPPVPVEYADHLDENAVPGGGDHNALDPGQTLYTEAPDTAGGNTPVDAFDWFPGLESGMEPDSQVDALANRQDAFFDALVSNSANLIFSLGGDPNSIAVFGERPDGSGADGYAHTDLNNPDPSGRLDDVDAIELWGPVDSGGTGFDADFYSLQGDVTGTSIFSASGPYISQAAIHAEVAGLGFSGVTSEVDVDGLLVKDANGNSTWDLGDEIVFSLRAAASYDGGEVVHWVNGASASFLSHGGHLWNTAFSPGALVGFASDEVDALEADNGTVVSPAAIVPVATPALGIAGLLGLLGLLGAAGSRWSRARAG